MSSSRLINRNVVAGRGRTSMRLEPEVWDALIEICRRERQDLNGLVRQIEATGHAGGRTSAVRVFVVQYFRNAASEVERGASPHVAALPGRSASRLVGIRAHKGQSSGDRSY